MLYSTTTLNTISCSETEKSLIFSLKTEFSLVTFSCGSVVMRLNELAVIVFLNIYSKLGLGIRLKSSDKSN